MATGSDRAVSGPVTERISVWIRMRNVPAEAPRVRLRQPRRFLEMCAVSWHPVLPYDHPNFSADTAPLSLRGEKRYGNVVRAHRTRDCRVASLFAMTTWAV